jgi:acyl carrier protein
MPQVDDKMLEKDLRDMIAKIVELEPDSITLDANFVEDLGMDSMMALEILAAIEKKYKIQVPEEKLNQLKNLGETIKLTKAYL